MNCRVSQNVMVVIASKRSDEAIQPTGCINWIASMLYSKFSLYFSLIRLHIQLIINMINFNPIQCKHITSPRRFTPFLYFLFTYCKRKKRVFSKENHKQTSISNIHENLHFTSSVYGNKNATIFDGVTGLIHHKQSIVVVF